MTCRGLREREESERRSSASQSSGQGGTNFIYQASNLKETLLKVLSREQEQMIVRHKLLGVLIVLLKGQKGTFS